MNKFTIEYGKYGYFNSLSYDVNAYKLFISHAKRMNTGRRALYDYNY